MVNFWSSERRCEIITEPEQVAAQMRSRLGIDLAIAMRALQAGAAEAAMTTNNSTAGAAGSRLWDGAISQMREDLAPSGWTIQRPGQLEVVRRPDNLVQITASLGDEGTGDPIGVPSAEHPRGESTAHAVAVNDRTFAAVEGGEHPGFDPIDTWWLLYRPSGFTKIRAELSLPIEMAGKRIVAWAVRLILPDLEYDDGISRPQPDAAPEPEVVFQRRVG